MPAAPDPRAGALVAGRPDAERMLGSLAAAMAALQAALETEAGHIAAGRLRQGLAAEGRKAELSAAYLLSLQACKRDVVTLARFAPDRLQAFREAQAAFQASVEQNLAVVATARAVSEGLMRSLAEETRREGQPVGYGARGAPERTAPLAFSGRF